MADHNRGAGPSLLAEAVLVRDLARINELLAGGVPVHASDDPALDPVALAATTGFEEGLTAMLPHADVNRRYDLGGDTKCLLELSLLQPAIVQRLLDAGADPCQLIYKGQTVFHRITLRLCEPMEADAPSVNDFVRLIKIF